MDTRANEADDEDEEEKNNDSEARAVALFIQHMIENGFSEQLAVNALKADVDPTEFEEGK